MGTRTNKPATSKKPKRSTKAPVAARLPLAQASPDKSFWVNYGPVLKDLRELRDALAGDISDEQFAYHVGAGKNDFATWVRDVLGDTECAASLRRTRSKAGALRAVEQSLVRYGT